MKQISINLNYSCNRNCSFCYAKGFLEKWPGEISLQGMETIFKWITKQRTKNVNFTGGEPTLFSKINPALKLAERYNIKITLCTNGIFNSKKIDIESPAINAFVVSLNPPSRYSLQELKTLYSNLKVLKRTSKRLIFRFNIVSTNVSYQYLIDACERLNVRNIEFSPVLPSIFEKNEYIKKENLKDCSRYILRLVKDLLKHNIQSYFPQPFPLCFFSKRERAFLIKNSKLHGTCSVGKNYAITPRLTVLPCVSLAFEGPPLDNFKDEREISNYYKKIIDKLKWKIDLFPQCKNCLFKKNKQCQGSCLVYKFLQYKNSKSNSTFKKVKNLIK